MHKIFVLIFFLFLARELKAQKPVLDTSAIQNWPSLGRLTLSHNGKYVIYSFDNAAGNSSVAIVQSTFSNWKIELPNVGNIQFAGNSRAYFLKGDSLGCIDLGQATTSYILQVNSYQISESNGQLWLVYQSAKPGNELIVKNLQTNRQSAVSSVISYHLDPASPRLIWQTKSANEPEKQSVQLSDLSVGGNLTIWEGTKARNFIFDHSGKQLAFIGQEAVDSQDVIWYYTPGINKAMVIAGYHTLAKDTARSVFRLLEFLAGDSELTFQEKSSNVSKHIDNMAKVDIWNYQDGRLQFQQQSDVSDPTIHLQMQMVNLNIKNHTMVHIGNYERIYPNGTSGDSVLIESTVGDEAEWFWNKSAKPSYYLTSLTNGSRQLLKHVHYFPLLSPDKKFVVYFDRDRRNYFSYETATGRIRNITGKTPVDWTCFKEYDVPVAKRGSYGYVGWLVNSKGVLICDQFDIWQADPRGIKPPINLTNGYGRRHHTRFSPAFESNELIPGNKLLLLAFDKSNKNNGFYQIRLGDLKEPVKLTMAPYMYSWPFLNGLTIIKARDTETYVVRRESATTAPNYFLTHDFKTFTAISHIQPQLGYNWLTTELVNWHGKDGKALQGILFKPEDFDAHKKYPVIFYFYERLSDGLNEFIDPDYSNGAINIPWFVSHDYLVFTPDIYYTPGHTGAGVINSVVSAANMLAERPYVDPAKMGIQGHSFGGYEVDYLVTHTHKFTAAVSASGVSDLASYYGSAARGGFAIFCSEIGQNRMDAYPSRRPDLYIENSPVFFTNKVNTPLLLMNNKADSSVPFSQGVEFFTALRRLGKKAWMLQYDDGNHTVEGQTAKDFTLRMDQFFDHYLKGAPAPKWMVEGISAAKKGADDGFGLEPVGIVPGPGLINIK